MSFWGKSFFIQVSEFLRNESQYAVRFRGGFEGYLFLFPKGTVEIFWLLHWQKYQWPFLKTMLDL